MGLILDTDDDAKIHTEARRESFVIYDDYGRNFDIELEWSWLPHLERAVSLLRKHVDAKGISTEEIK